MFLFAEEKTKGRKQIFFNNWSCKLFQRNIQFILFFFCYDLSNPHMKHHKNEKKKEKYKLSSEISKVTMTTFVCSE